MRNCNVTSNNKKNLQKLLGLGKVERFYRESSALSPFWPWMNKGPDKWSDQVVFFKPRLRNSHRIYFVTAVYITVKPRGLVMNYCAKHWKIQIKMTVSVSESLYVKCKAGENGLMQRDRTTQGNISFRGQSDKQWSIPWGFFSQQAQR